MKCHLGTKVPRKKHRLEVFANRGLQRIFGSQREEVAGGWKRVLFRIR